MNKFERDIVEIVDKNKPATKYLSVMLIDDNEVDNFINSKILKGSLFAENIFIHTSAKSALEYLQNLQDEQVMTKSIPELIFLDVDMPVHDGFSFLSDFESLNESIRKETKIIMLTNSINPMDTERAKNNQYVSGYLNKPLNEKALEEL